MSGVAIIGAGNVGRIRAQVMEQSPECCLKIVADVDQARARELAHGYGAQATGDWHAAATAPDVDIVVICTPTKFHAEAAITALQAGKHVLCEKPLARSFAEAEAVVATAENCERVLKTGFNYRHMHHVRKAKELIEADSLGTLYFLRCRYGHGGRPGYENHWCTDQELSGGGALFEQGIHIIDLVRYLLGEPAQVLAHTSRFFWPFPEVEDNSFVLLETISSRSAQIHVSWTQWINLFSLEIFGRDGYLHLTGRDRHYGPQRLVWGRRQPDHTRPQEEIFDFPPDDSWEREWSQFLSATRTSSKPGGDSVDSLRALHIIEAAYESSRRKAWVHVAMAAEEVGRKA
jgi:predicted dehydrogenase